MQTEGARNKIIHRLISGRPALPPEPHLPPFIGPCSPGSCRLCDYITVRGHFTVVKRMANRTAGCFSEEISGELHHTEKFCGFEAFVSFVVMLWRQ